MLKATELALFRSSTQDTIYLFKVAVETPNKCVNRVVLVSLIVKFEQITHVVLVFPFVDFEQVNVGCVTGIV